MRLRTLDTTIAAQRRWLAVAALAAAALIVLVTSARAGSLDRSFGQGGTIHVGFGSRAITAEAGWRLALAPDGSSVLAGGPFVISRHGPEGRLDQRFGEGGFTQVHFPQSKSERVGGVAVQADGKIVVVGKAVDSCQPSGRGGCPARLAIARLTTAGALDRSFAHGGLLLSSVMASASSVALLPDGKLLVGGYGQDRKFALARFLPSGSLDRSFGADGAAGAEAPAESPRFGLGSVSDIIVEPDGSSVLAIVGGTGLPERLVRYTALGSPDQAFGNRGFTVVDGTPNTRVEGSGSLALEPDGELLAAATLGYFRPAALLCFQPDGELNPGYGASGVAIAPESLTARGSADVAVQSDGRAVVTAAGEDGLATARFQPDGEVDTSYGSDGVTAPLHTSDMLATVAVTPSGDVLAAGQGLNSYGQTAYQVLARYDPTGTLDPEFGSKGVEWTAIAYDSEDLARAIAVRDGRIVVAGDSAFGFALARFTRNGRIDRSFGDQGRVTTHIRSGHLHAVTVERNGDTVVAGEGYAGRRPNSGTGLHGFAVVRYTTGGALDRGFGTEGVVLTPTGVFGTARAIVALPHGKLLVAGEGANHAVLARYSSNGSLDPSFGGDGIVRLPNMTTARAVNVQRDGRILITGATLKCVKRPRVSYCIRRDMAIARLRVDGRLDRSFGHDGSVFIPHAFGVAVRATRKGVVAVGHRSGCTNRQGTKPVGPCRGLVIVRRTRRGAALLGFGDRRGALIVHGTGAVRAATIDRRGRIFVAGNTAERFVVSAFGAGGSRLRGFGHDGISRLVLVPGAPRAAGIAIQRGSVLLAGSGVYPIGGMDFVLARLDGP